MKRCTILLSGILMLGSFNSTQPFDIQISPNVYPTLKAGSIVAAGAALIYAGTKIYGAICRFRAPEELRWMINNEECITLIALMSCPPEEIRALNPHSLWPYLDAWKLLENRKKSYLYWMGWIECTPESQHLFFQAHAIIEKYNQRLMYLANLPEFFQDLHTHEAYQLQREKIKALKDQAHAQWVSAMAQQQIN